MKKIYISLLFFLQFCFPVFSQDEIVRQFSHNYFRPDPFETEFNIFMQRLVGDQAIQNKEISKKTDTSLYYFYGTYSNYNPFFFKPKRVEVLLEETIMEYSDSAKTRDTVLVYQLMAFVDINETGKKEVKKEFDKIHRQYYKKFDGNKTKEITEDNLVVGSIHNYFLSWYSLSPMSIGWKEIYDSKEIVLSISIRIKPIHNQTGLAGFFYHPE